MMKLRLLVRTIWEDFRRSWKPLLVGNLAARMLAAGVLAPLTGLIPYAFLRLAGETVVTDQQIIFFFLRPLGLIALIVIGAVFLALLVAENAILLTIACAARNGKRIGAFPAFKFVSLRAAHIVRLSARVIAGALAISAPFLAFAAIVYLALLRQFDINYYLREKPPAFWLAAALGILAASCLAYLLAKRIIGWIFAFPILLFEKRFPRESLREASQRTQDSRLRFLLCFAMWAMAAFAVAAVLNGIVAWLGSLVIVRTQASLSTVLLALWLFLAAWTLGSLAISFASSASFALLTSCLYKENVQNADGARDWLNGLQDIRGASKTSRRLLWPYVGAGFGILATGLIVGVGLMNSVRFDDQTTVTAHRGAAGAAPENTLASVRKALEAGARWVEIDVQEDADGEVVVIHDSDFKKIADLDLKVYEATSRQLRQIDIGSWFDPEFRDERVPTLAQVLEVCKGKAGVNIELKYYGKNKRLEERVVEIVEQQGMADDVLIMSLKLDGVQKVRELRPTWKTGLLVSVAMGDLSQLDMDFLAVNTSLASLSFIQKAHDHGKEVFVWTVNDPLVMATMVSRGADSLITDEPARAARVLREIDTLNPIERVLLHIGGELGMLREGKHASRAREEGI